MATVVFALCAVTSLVCASLLGRGYLRTRTRLLLWTSLCFAGLAANNLLLVADELIFTDRDLGAVRGATAVAGLAVLLFGLIWDSDQ